MFFPGDPFYIYLIHINNCLEKYAGQTVDLQTRKDNHEKEKGILGEMIRKYGCDYEIITTVYAKRFADICEALTIRIHNTFENGFNKSSSGLEKYNKKTDMHMIGITKGPIHKEWDRMCQEWSRKGIKSNPELQVEKKAKSKVFKPLIQEEVRKNKEKIKKKFREWENTSEGRWKIQISKNEIKKLLSELAEIKPQSLPRFYFKYAS